MNKHEKILQYIAKKRLGFFYVYQDTKVAFDTYENAIERAVTILKINEEQVVNSDKVSPDMVVLNGMIDFSPPVKTETEKV